jgi:hypothetical protein
MKGNEESFIKFFVVQTLHIFWDIIANFHIIDKDL